MALNLTLKHQLFAEESEPFLANQQTDDMHEREQLFASSGIEHRTYAGQEGIGRQHVQTLVLHEHYIRLERERVG